MISNTKGGLLLKAQSLLAETTPKFNEWTAKFGFKYAGIFSQYKTESGEEFYIMSEASGLNAKTIASSVTSKEFWNGKLSKAFEWQCFSKDFNELPPFAELFSEDFDSINSLYFLPFADKENPMYFVAIEKEDDEPMNLPSASECANTLRNIVELQDNAEKKSEYLESCLDKGLKISTANLFILSLKNCVEKMVQTIDIERKLSKFDMVDRIELKARIVHSVTKVAYSIIEPMFKSPNCINFDRNNSDEDMKIVIFAKDELDEKLISFHIATSLVELLGEDSTKQAIMLYAGICPNKKGTISFLQKN